MSELNNYPASIAGDTSTNALLQEIDALLEESNQITNCARVRRSSRRKTIEANTMPITISNNQNCTTGILSTSRVDSESILSTSTVETKNPGKRRGRRKKEECKPLTAKHTDTVQSNIIGDNTDCNTNILSTSQVKCESISSISMPQATRKRRGRPSRKAKEVLVRENNAIIETRNTASITDTEKNNENLTLEFESTLQETLIKPAPTDINNDHESRTEDKAAEVENDSQSTQKKPSPISIHEHPCNTPKKITIPKNATIDSDPPCERENRICEPKTSKIILAEAEQMKIISSPGCAIENAPSITHSKVDATLAISELDTKCTSENIEGESSVTQEQTNSILNETKPKPKRNRKPRVKVSNKLIKSELVPRVEGNTECKTIGTFSTSQEQTDLILKATQPKPKPIHESRATTPKELIKSELTDQGKANPTCEINDMVSDIPKQTELILETTKPKTRRKQKVKSKEPEVPMKLDTNIHNLTGSPVEETENRPSDNTNIYTLTPSRSEWVLKPGTYKSKDGMLKKSKLLDKIEASTNPPIEIEYMDSESLPQNNTLSEIPMIKNNQTYHTEEIFRQVQPKVDITDIQITETSSKTVDNKYPLTEKIYQPQVILQNIAYSDKLTTKQKVMIFKNNQSKKCLSKINVSYSSTDRSVDHHITPQVKKRKRKRTQSIPSTAGILDSKKHEFCKKRKITQSKPPALSSWDKIYAAQLTVRDPETNSSSASQTDILSLLGNEVFSINNRTNSPIQSTQQHNSSGERFSRSMVSSEKQIQMRPLSDTLELDTPLNLSMRSLNQSMSNQLDSCTSNVDSITEVCSARKKNLFGNIKVNNNGFGSSTLNITNISTSSTEIDNGICYAARKDNSSSNNLQNNTSLQSDTFSPITEVFQPHKKKISSISKETKSKITCTSKTKVNAQKQPNRAHETQILPRIPTISKCTTEKASLKSEKVSSDDRLSIKVSLPAEHYLEKKSTKHEKIEKTTKPRKRTPKTIKIKSHTESDTSKTVTISKPDYNHSKRDCQVNITYPTTHHKPDKTNLTTTRIKTTGGNSDQHSILHTLLSTVSDNADANLQKIITKSDTNVTDMAVPSEPAPLGSSKKLYKSDIKNLPRIIADEIFPKGTITWPAISYHKSSIPPIAANTVNESVWDSIGKNQQFGKPTIFNQTTSTSTVNMSQSRITAHSWTQSHSSNDVGNTFDNACEYQNINNTSTEEICYKVQLDSKGQSSNIDDQSFNSKELWNICPELEEHFKNDDIVNNNNDQISILSSSNVAENNLKPDNIEIEANKDNHTDLQEHNVMHIPTNGNNLRYASEGVIAINIDYNQIEVESSASSTINNESNSLKKAVIGNLTTANLRNFNNLTNSDAKGGSWDDYLSQGYIAEPNNKPMPNVTSVESSWAGTLITTETRTESYQAELKKRKRKWTESEKSRSAGLSSIGKRFKLDRKRWSNEGREKENKNNFQELISIESINSDNSVIVNADENTRLPTKVTHRYEKLDTVNKSIQHEPNLDMQIIEASQSSKENAKPGVSKEKTEKLDRVNKSIKYNRNLDAEIIEASQSCREDRKPEDFEGKLLNCTETITKDKAKISTISLSTINSTNSSRLQNDLHLSFPESAQSYNSDIDKIDRNENVISMRLSNSSSLLDKKSDTNNSNRSMRSKNSDTSKLEINDPEKLCKDQYGLNKRSEEDYDDDCISLFAESIFTNADQASSFADVITSLLDDPKESVEEFQDMTNIGAYFDNNVLECNEAYESYKQEEKTVCNTLNIVSDNSTHIRNERLQNLNQLNFDRSMQSAGRELCTTTTVVENCRTDLRNTTSLKDRIGERRVAQNVFSATVASLFYRQCFFKLKQGRCQRKGCTYLHYLPMQLKRFDQQDLNTIHEIIDFAIFKGYYYYLTFMYPLALKVMDYSNIITLFFKISDKNLMSESFVINSINGAITIGTSLSQFLSDVACLMDANNHILADTILTAINGIVQPGAYWSTCRELLIKVKPFDISVNRIIYECVYNKDRLQIADVYENYVPRLTNEQISNININLRGQFDLLLVENNLIRETATINQQDVPFNEEYLIEDETLKTTFFAENDCKNGFIQPIISSPDDNAHSHCDTLSQPLLVENRELVNQEFSTRTVTKKNLNTGSSNSISNHPVLNEEKRRNSATEIEPALERNSSDSSILPFECNTTSSFDSSLKLTPIDDLPTPQSVFRDRHWKFHLAMLNLKEALKHEEYVFALKILDKYSSMEQTLFTKSCYKMLCQNVMVSSHHVKNMIKLSGHFGVNKSLNETLFNLGMYLMIDLCNANAWVVAYSLFKTLQYFASSMDNIAAFALISAEICLANRRPLKAFTILKQKNMLCTSRNKWHVSSNPSDERVRDMIINLLLDVLCQEYPSRAFYIFTNLIRDQAHIYHPVDLTAHVDKLVTGILNAKCNDSIIDVGRLIIQNNFALTSSVFQSLVINTFHSDIALCKQLYRYGTWLGVYSVVRLTLPLHVLIKTNWTKEEMYLVIADFLTKLSLDIGPTINRIRPNQFAIHLVFELMPFKQRPPDHSVQISNKDELKMSKELMKTVLREQFNPPITTILAEKERFMKLKSRSVIEYLKSMMLDK